MANHVRRQIREAIASAVTGLATTGAHVYQSRVYPLADANLPALLVYAEDETVEALTMDEPRTLQRNLRVTVAAVTKQVDTLDDVLDAICQEVEVALAMPVAALAGLAKSITLSTTEIDFVGGSEKPVGRARLTYAIDYYVLEDAPDVAL